MATQNAIAAVSMTIKSIFISEAGKVPEFDDPQFKLYQAKDFASTEGTANAIDEGISIYLYRVAVNGAMRNHPARVTQNGMLKRTPLPVDLCYLLTPWSKDAAMKHRMIGWAMRTLENYALLPATLLNSSINEPVFSSDESVELICDPLSVQELANIWNTHQHILEFSLAYLARLVLIDDSALQNEAPLVKTRQFDLAKAEDK